MRQSRFRTSALLVDALLVGRELPDVGVIVGDRVSTSRRASAAALGCRAGARGPRSRMLPLSRTSTGSARARATSATRCHARSLCMAGTYLLDLALFCFYVGRLVTSVPWRRTASAAGPGTTPDG